MKTSPIKAGLLTLALLTAALLLTACANEVVEPPLPSFGPAGTADDITDPPTEPDTVAPADPETGFKPETETETEPETEPEVSIDRYPQVPLVSLDDTTSRLIIPEFSTDGVKQLKFLLLPDDDPDGGLVPAHTITLTPWLNQNPTELEVNLQIFHLTHPMTQDVQIAYICEYSYIAPEDGSRVVGFECAMLNFLPNRPTIGYVSKSHEGSLVMSYTEQTKSVELTKNKKNLSKIRAYADRLSRESELYDMVLLYSNQNGEETANQSISAYPKFGFELIDKYSK